jgi:hypothetical protein
MFDGLYEPMATLIARHPQASFEETEKAMSDVLKAAFFSARGESPDRRERPFKVARIQIWETAQGEGSAVLLAEDEETHDVSGLPAALELFRGVCIDYFIEEKEWAPEALNRPAIAAKANALRVSLRRNKGEAAVRVRFGRDDERYLCMCVIAST